MIRKKRGFTLIELLVVVIIIAVLAAVAVPQYRKAVLKSRYSTLMPVANSLAKGNEVYYLANGEYTDQEANLDIEGQSSAPEGTTITLEADPEYLSYVRVANNDKVPNARYVVYQQHSKNFAGTTMCEAKDDTAKELCQSLGGVFVSENGTEAEWTAYVLSGQLGSGDSFIPPPTCPENGVCDDNLQLTGCTSGYYVKDGVCVTYDYAGDTVCTDSGTNCTEKAFGDNAKCMLYAQCFGATFTGESSCTTYGYCSSSSSFGITTFTDNATCSNRAVCTGATFADTAQCRDKNTVCESATFADNATCSNSATCYGATFSGDSKCEGGKCARYGDLITTFTDNAICLDSDCANAAFSGNARCQDGSCSSSGGDTTTFTDNARCSGRAQCAQAAFSGNSACVGQSRCYGSVFSGNALCNSTHSEGCASASFKDNARCWGTGCDGATYEGNACCGNCSVGSGKPKCGGGTW